MRHEEPHIARMVEQHVKRMGRDYRVIAVRYPDMKTIRFYLSRHVMGNQCRPEVRSFSITDEDLDPVMCSSFPEAAIMDLIEARLRVVINLFEGRVFRIGTRNPKRWASDPKQKAKPWLGRHGGTGASECKAP